MIGKGEGKSLVWPRGPLIRRNTVTEFSKVLYSVTRSCQNKTVSNDNLRIETDRYNLPKIPEPLRICQPCLSNKVENEINFLFKCNLNKI